MHQPARDSWRASPLVALRHGPRRGGRQGASADRGVRFHPALLLACAAAIAACGEGAALSGGLADRPSAPMTAREPLAPGAAGLTWALPSGLEDDWGIGPQGVGRLLVGAPSAGASDGGVTCSAVRPPGAPEGVLAWASGGRVLAITVDAPGPRTLHGIEVGAEASTLRRAYGDRLEAGEGPDAGWLVVQPPPTLAGHPIAFRVEGGVVRRIRVGRVGTGDCR